MASASSDTHGRNKRVSESRVPAGAAIHRGREGMSSTSTSAEFSRSPPASGITKIVKSHHEEETADPTCAPGGCLEQVRHDGRVEGRLRARRRASRRSLRRNEALDRDGAPPTWHQRARDPGAARTRRRAQHAALCATRGPSLGRGADPGLWIQCGSTQKEPCNHSKTNNLWWVARDSNSEPTG